MRELSYIGLSQLTTPTIAEDKVEILTCSESEVILESNEGIWSLNFEVLLNRATFWRCKK